MEPFNFLELQLIKSSLGTKTDGELAALLERPVEEVHAMINDITGGFAEERSTRMQNVREQEHLQKTEKQKRKNQVEERREYLRQRREREDKRRKHSTEVANSMAAQKANKERLESRKVFKTREIDMSKLISVRIDHKTIVFVKPGTNIEDVKKQYARKPIGAEV